MKRRHRILKIAKWTALALFVVLAFFCGPWGFVRFGGATPVVGIGGGYVWKQDSPDMAWLPTLGPRVEWFYGTNGWPSSWFGLPWSGTRSITAGSWQFDIKPFVLLFGAAAVVLWLVERRCRPRPGRCACGYDLTGNTSGRCPECGRVVTSAGEALR